MSDLNSGSVLPQGFYHIPVHQRMPARPETINASFANFCGLFGKVEVEEAARFLVLLAQQYGTWCGVTWAALALLIRADAEKERMQELRKLANQQAVKQYAWEMAWYRAAVVCSLGIYCVFCRRPQSEVKPVEDQECLFGDILSLVSADQFVEGFHGLIREKMVYLATRDGETIIFPTEKLVSEILHAEGRIRSQTWKKIAAHVS